jgi:hypothetical protein
MILRYSPFVSVILSTAIFYAVAGRFLGPDSLEVLSVNGDDELIERQGPIEMNERQRTYYTLIIDLFNPVSVEDPQYIHSNVAKGSSVTVCIS